MKGVARADGQPSGDYEAIVLALSRLSNAVIADRTPHGALAAAAETGAVLLQADSGVAILLDPSSDLLEVIASYGADLSGRPFPVPAEVVARQCIKTGQPVIVANLAADGRPGLAVLAKHGLSSVLCVPISAVDGSVGALMVASAVMRAFSASDIEVLSAVAGQAAFAAWRSRPPAVATPEPGPGKNLAAGYDTELIDLANRKIQELSIVNKVSEAVISTLDLPELLNLALDQCLIAVGATVGSIMLLDGATNRLSIKVAKGLSAEVIESTSVAIGEGIAGWVAENAQPVLVHDAKNDPRFRLQQYREDVTSAMSIPLKAHGRVIGVLNASTTESGRRFGPREVEFISTMANQVAMAIDNAQLYDVLERRSVELASLLRLSEAITSTLQLKEVLVLLVERFRSMAQVDACALLYYDIERGRFRCLDGEGLSKESRKSVYTSLALPIATQALETGAPVWGEVGAGSKYTTETAVAEGFSSAVSVPLTASGRTIGAAALFSAAHRAFSGPEIEMLSALGGLAGVAVRNAMVYQHKHEIARSLQFKLVPTVPLSANGLEIGHKFRPAREIGGDYYDLVKVSPGKAGIVIADVTGSSVPAAIYTSMGKNVLRAYALDNDSPADVLRRLNRIACDETHPEVFISMFYGVFDSADRVFRYASGGHEPPILYRPDGSFERLRADGLLVGVTADAAFEEKKLQLEPGSILVLFTDGVVDSADVRGKFGIDEIEEIVSSDPLKPAQELADNIYTRLIQIAGSRARDDVALVVLKVM